MKEYFMSLAIEEAKKSLELNEVPIGAIVVKDGIVIGRGHNLKETTSDATEHAELIAIKEAVKHIGDWRLIDCELYTTLEPCAMCAGAILNSRVDKVFIGAKDLRMGCCGTVINLLDMPSFNHKSVVEFGVLESECSSILSEFFKSIRNKK